MSIQQCRKISDELCRDSEAESRSRCSLGVGELQYVCDNTFVYNKHFVQKPKWVNISCAILYTRKPNMGFANCNAVNMPVL